MKKATLPSLLLAGLTALSFFCYLHLQLMAANAIEPALSSTEENVERFAKSQEPGNVSLNLNLVKHAINITKIVLPQD